MPGARSGRRGAAPGVVRMGQVYRGNAWRPSAEGLLSSKRRENVAKMAHWRMRRGVTPYFPAFTSSSAISRSLNFCTFMEGVMGKSSTKNTRLGTLYRAMRGIAHSRTASSVRSS